MSDSRPIGIFDSGVGGLTVVGQVRKMLPRERIVYFGDTARVPYGTKSKETVTKFSVENIEFLMRNDVKMVIVACNTASALSLAFLKKCFRVPIIGVIEPGARAAVSVTRNKKIGVIGTSATVASGSYEKTIKRIDPRMSLFAQSCPLFVPLVEEGWIDTDVTRKMAETYLRPLKKKGIDTLIMGCTHYPILKDVIQKTIGKEVLLVDSAKEVAKETKDILDASGLLNHSRAEKAHSFFVSDEPARFIKMAETFLKTKIRCVKRSS
jgi:glutamate racemase